MTSAEIAARRSVSSFSPASSMSRRIRTSGSSTSSISSRQAAAAQLLALPVGKLCSSSASAAAPGPRSGSEATLLGQLAERIGAPRRLEQISGDLRVMGKFGGTSQRLGVMGDHRPRAERLHELRRALALPASTSPPCRLHRSASAGSSPNSAPSGVAGARTATANSRQPGSRARSATRDRRCGRGRRSPAHGAPCGAGAAPPRPSRAPPRAGAADRAAQTDGRCHAASSGPAAAATAPAGRARPGCRAWRWRAAWRGARRRRTRSGSACAWRRRSRRRSPSTVSSEPKRWSSSAAVLSPIPGTPGMLSLVSPLRPMKSGTSSGGIP